MDAGLFCAASLRTRRARFPGTGLSSDERQVPLRLSAFRIPHGSFSLIACAPSPCGPSLTVSRLVGRYPDDYCGHSVAVGLASLRRSHVHTAVRIEHDLGVPSVSLNALTGHRSGTPEDAAG